MGKVKTPRCKVCNRVEFYNRVYVGYIFEGKVSFYGDSETICKDCEKKQEIIARTKYGDEPIYKRF